MGVVESRFDQVIEILLLEMLMLPEIHLVCVNKEAGQGPISFLVISLDNIGMELADQLTLFKDFIRYTLTPKDPAMIKSWRFHTTSLSF